MTADISLKILVIILSATLAIFLLLAIAVMIKFLQVANGLKRITQKAEEIADKAEAVTDFFQNNAKHVMVGKFMANIADVVTRYNKHKNEGKK